MMSFIDTHAHLYDEQFHADRAAVIESAIQAGVEEIYLPNCNSETIEAMLELAVRWPGHCYPMMGLHPCYVKEDYEQELQIVAKELSLGKYFGVGEVGLDKYWDLSFLEAQRAAFLYQIDLSAQYKLPLVIHSREATQDCIDLVKSCQKGQLRGIFHCFSGTVEEAKQVVDLGFYLGIGGVVTFKRSNLPEIIKEVGLSHVVLETDAPYLAPVPYRGKRNESSYIPIIAQMVADVLEMPLEKVAKQTTENAKKVFTKHLN
jgi:TatD DNase family protein